MDELLEVVFSVRSVLRLYNEDQLPWWEGLCLFNVKKADQRQSEIK
jgi:hypothetical protein